jgi:DNA-directed RNA polymerase specialized sigma24 family protein
VGEKADGEIEAVLLLRYFDGMTPTQIAERLRCPLSSVKTLLARGLAKLRVDLDRQAWVNQQVSGVGGALPSRI